MSTVSIDGIILPNKPLTNIEITDAIKRLTVTGFRGVFVRDNLPRRPKRNECGILNLDDSSGKGTHWVCWYKKNNENYYFDSYGVQPPLELKRYLKDTIFYNTERLQPKGEVFCGHLCLFVLKRLTEGRKLQVIVNSLH